MELILSMIFGLLSAAGFEVPDIAKTLIVEIAGLMVVEVVKWSTGAALVGVLIAFLSVLTSKLLGRTNWFAKTPRWLFVVLQITRVVLLLAVIGIVTLIGALEGARRGADKVMTESDLADQLFPQIGNAGADLMATLHLQAPAYIENETDPAFDERAAENLEAFQKGKWELNIPEFKDRVSKAGDKMVADAIVAIKINAKKDYPMLRGGTGAKVLDWMMDKFGDAFVRNMGESQAKRHGVLKPSQALYNGLDALAQKSGVPDTVGHAELSSYVTDTIIIRPVLGVVQSMLRSHQMFLLFLSVAILLVATVGGSCRKKAPTSKRNGDKTEYEPMARLSSKNEK